MANVCTKELMGFTMPGMQSLMIARRLPIAEANIKSIKPPEIEKREPLETWSPWLSSSPFDRFKNILPDKIDTTVNRNDPANIPQYVQTVNQRQDEQDSGFGMFPIILAAGAAASAYFLLKG